MTRARTRLVTAAVVAAALGAGSTAAIAQAAGQQAAPNMPSPGTTIPEKIDPPLLSQDPNATGSTLSEKLQSTDGVIKPPAGIAEDMRVPAPVPNPGTTPVIPPPGSPGGSQRIDPK